MKYSQFRKGMYVVRTKELRWLGAIMGAICYVDRADAGSIQVRITDDCVPVGSPYSIGAEADDGCWYDVSDLVMTVNSCIAPYASTDAFPNAVSVNYRNFLGLGEKVKPYNLREAVGNVCLIGEAGPQGVVFARNGYYVADVDSNGYIIAYQGYCDYRDDESTRKLTLRVLNFNGTNRALYPAREIVGACAKACQEDCDKAMEYVEQIRQDTIVSAADSAFSAQHGSVSELELEGTAC